MTDASAPRRHSRAGLFGPLILALAVLAAWTGWWFYLVNQIEARLEAQAAALRSAGWTVRYNDVRIAGWPFRARLALSHPTIAAPSGQALSAPSLVAEANAYNPTRWVLVAPEGLTLARPGKGEVAVRGQALRLSMHGLTQRWPNIAVELAEPVFTAHPGAEPFPISRAQRIEFYMRPHLEGSQAATDEFDVLFRMIEARGRAGGPVDGLAQQGVLTAQVEGVVQRASALSGQDTAGVLSAWTRAGGRFMRVRGELQAGESRATLASQVLSVGEDGRLEGQVTLRAEQPAEALAGLARSGSGAVNRMGAASAAAATASGALPSANLTVTFREGRSYLGPFPVAPAPKLF